MQPRPLRTTVIGSYPFPSWLEFASAHLDQFGADDVAELIDDAVVCAIHDQVAAGLDVITDGEQTRLDFNLSFYGYLRGIAWELNYRGELDFLHQARRQQAERQLRVEDGWLYFLHGWTQVISHVLDLRIDAATFDRLAAEAASLR